MKVFYLSSKVLYIMLIMTIFIIAIILILYNNYFKAEEIYLPITNRVVAIDPGHGGVDPGAVSKSGILEDDINLKISLNLKNFINIIEFLQSEQDPDFQVDTNNF